MSNQDKIRVYLKEAVEAARAGEREKARKLLLKITDMDSSNERAWFLLASMEKNTSDKRIYLENVLFVNPNNEKAQQMLNALGDGEKEDRPEKPGLSARQRLYIGAGVLIVWIILEATLFSVGTGRRTSATATSVAIAGTLERLTQIVDFEFQTGVALTQSANQTLVVESTGQVLTLTATFGASSTPVPPTVEPTVLTLPPEATVQLRTDTPTPADTPTPSLSGAALPTDLFAGNIIAAWGGQDVSSNGFLPIRLYQLDQGNEYILLDSVSVNNVDINPGNGQTLVYSRFFNTTFSTGIERSNINGTQPQLINDLWRPLATVIEPAEVQYSTNGTHLVFTGFAESSSTREVFMVDFTIPPAPNTTPLVQLTDDVAEWSNPTISPDGSTVVAVRIDENSLSPEPDLWAIDTATGDVRQLTQDGNSLVETHTRFSTDGESIVYVGSPENANNPGDMIRLPLAAGGLPVPIIRSVEVDERYPVFSPDGRYLAYASDVTGVFNIFIRDLQSEVDYQLTTEELDPAFPGGWYQPDAVPPQPQLAPLPTPVILNQEGEDDGN